MLFLALCLAAYKFWTSLREMFSDWLLATLHFRIKWVSVVHVNTINTCSFKRACDKAAPAVDTVGHVYV
jgi:hypothetical protein